MKPPDLARHQPRYRVLLVHATYRQRGGEDAVVEAEEALLRQGGHAVETYRRHNDEVAGRSPLGLFRDTVWSARSRREVAQRLASFRPDIVHVHNSFPLISPAVYWAAADAGVPVVQTVHNFRLVCPQAMLLREGRVCEDCVGRVPWRAVVRRCYRDSASQSAAVAVMLQVHRSLGTWDRRVTRYVALNEFCRDKLVAGGLPAERISVKPNFLDLPAPAPRPREGLLFVGRLSSEKGVDVLAAAMRQLGGRATLHVVGDGPRRAALEGVPGVVMHGPLPPEAVYERMASAAALVLPSIWYEAFPRTLVEAFAHRLPVVASRLGALATLVDDGVTGLHFEPGNADDLAATLARIMSHPVQAAAMGEAARGYFERHLNAVTNHAALMEIYRQAIADTAAIGARLSGAGSTP